MFCRASGQRKALKREVGIGRLPIEPALQLPGQASTLATVHRARWRTHRVGGIARVFATCQNTYYDETSQGWWKYYYRGQILSSSQFSGNKYVMFDTPFRIIRLFFLIPTLEIMARFISKGVFHLI